jgi:hypothetical protein
MMTPVGRLAIIRTFPKSELLVAMNFVKSTDASVKIATASANTRRVP